VERTFSISATFDFIVANTIEGNTCYEASQMSSFWDRIYQTDNPFFGEEPSNFALSCYNQYLKKNNLKKILDLACGQGRDTLFFASEGIEISALDYSSAAIDGLIKRAKERILLISIHTFIFDARSNNTLPFDCRPLIPMIMLLNSDTHRGGLKARGRC
jgi:2-polyprenyl-3-methyl-5-hydroxy-6-metoxy-1,4-benzoquinol methylase